ncbi:MAG: class I SAM-dependent methyltransferase [Spirochaetaceae bacterium]
MNHPDSLFDAFMYPLEVLSLNRTRRRLIARARGDVLEIGAGTGANLSYYDRDQVRSIALTDLSIGQKLRERAARFQSSRENARGTPVYVRAANAMQLPFPDDSFDTVVVTLVFCSVPDQAVGFAEIRRVLRPAGRLLFIEHVRPHNAARHLVDRLNPLWFRVTRECNINRDTAGAMRATGFQFDELTVGGKGFLIHGVAR